MLPPLVSREPVAIVLRCQARLLAAGDLVEATTALANDLAEMLGARNVHIGIRSGSASRLLATSHAAGAERQLRHRQALIDAMDEAIDQGQLIRSSRGAASLVVNHAHIALGRLTGADISTVPLAADGNPVGAILIEADHDTPPDDPALDTLAELATLAAPLIRLRDKAEAPLHRRLLEQARESYSRKSAPRRAALAVGLALVIAGIAVPLPASISATARLEGEVQRTLVAPVDGFIDVAFVRPGDTVTAGQLLARLSDRDLKLERERLLAELAQHENAFAAAQSRSDRGQMVLAHAKRTEVAAQIALADERLERIQIRAPIDSVVLTGDLDQAGGTPVSRGDTLLVVAPAKRHRLIVEVDERDIAEISSDASGTLALKALPQAKIPFAVTRIMPVTTARDGRHFIEVEGRLNPGDDAVQPGMEGFARIDAGHSPLFAQWSRRIRAWFGLQLWRWTGA